MTPLGLQKQYFKLFRGNDTILAAVCSYNLVPVKTTGRQAEEILAGFEWEDQVKLLNQVRMDALSLSWGYIVIDDIMGLGKTLDGIEMPRDQSWEEGEILASCVFR